MIENNRIREIEALITPLEVKQKIPLSEDMASHVHSKRNEIEKVLSKVDERLLVIVGPCSVHDPAAAIEYAERLQALSQSVSDALCIVMRVYFEKPRTTMGWKGYINDPDLNDQCDINKGLLQARGLLKHINALGLAIATEFLDTIVPQYISDYIAWAAIGARTSESQIHRNCASGLSMPVGFKNSTTGDIAIAVDAVYAAAHQHDFLGVTETGAAAIVRTNGNPYVHVILRGGKEGPNYEEKDVAGTLKLLAGKGLPERVMIDCSHANSQKDHRNQARVLQAIEHQLQAGQTNIIGVMIESFLKAGNQSLESIDSLEYGKSVTDSCISWQETETLLHGLADTVRRNRLLSLQVGSNE